MSSRSAWAQQRAGASKVSASEPDYIPSASVLHKLHEPRFSALSSSLESKLSRGGTNSFRPLEHLLSSRGKCSLK